MDQNFVLHIFEINMPGFMPECALHLDQSNKKSNILQKLHDSMRKSDFTNIWPMNLFEWIQSLTRNYLEIIVSSHIFFSNHFSIDFIQIKLTRLLCILLQ